MVPPDFPKIYWLAWLMIKLTTRFPTGCGGYLVPEKRTASGSGGLPGEEFLSS
jgi:hypothetical protein